MCTSVDNLVRVGVIQSSGKVVKDKISLISSAILYNHYTPSRQGKTIGIFHEVQAGSPTPSRLPSEKIPVRCHSGRKSAV